MVYLKPLYSRLDHQRSQFYTEAQQEHVKISFFKMSYFNRKESGLKILSLYNKTTSTYTPEAMVVI